MKIFHPIEYFMDTPRLDHCAINQSNKYRPEWDLMEQLTRHEFIEGHGELKFSCLKKVGNITYQTRTSRHL